MNGINPTYIQGYASSITSIINGILVPVLISIAFIVFLWGIYKYFIQGASSEEDRKKGKIFSLYGIIGFVVLFSVWGIVNIFMGTLGLTASNVPSFPLLPSNTGSYGTTGTPGTGASTGTGITTAQSQADAVMNQAQSTYNAICAQYGSSSAQCQQAGTTLQQAFQSYKNAYGGSGSSNVGGSCTKNTDCSGSLTCDRGTCVQLSGANGCAIGSTLDESGGCVPTGSSANLGGSCTTLNDCSGDLICDRGTCVEPAGTNGCAEGYTLDEFGGCVSTSSGSAGLGGSCTDINGCSGDLVCVSGTCVEPTGENGCAASDPTCGGSTAVYGCTDPNATNYYASATQDDGSCSYPDESGGY